MISEKDELFNLIQTKAVIYGHKVLASGKLSHYYIDGKQVTLDARGAFLIGRCLLDLIRSNRPDAVGGPTLGADPIVGALLAEAGRQGILLHGFIVRKEAKDHGTSKLVEGPVFKSGARVALVEDVITTGKSSYEIINIVEQNGARVVAIASVVDRSDGAAIFQQPFYSLLKMNIKTYKPEECPLCREGRTPLTKPGSRGLK